MVSRRRKKRNVEEADESVGLSGWLYTDLMLGLAVVFLGASILKFPAEILDPPPGDNAAVTTSTTTTTTLPPSICSKLVVYPGERDPAKLVTISKYSSGDQLRSEFKSELGVWYQFLTDSGLVPPGADALDVEKTKIGVILAIAGDDSSNSDATTQRLKIYDLFPETINTDTLGRDTYSKLYDYSDVVMEVYPIVQYPCN